MGVFILLLIFRMAKLVVLFCFIIVSFSLALPVEKSLEGYGDGSYDCEKLPDKGYNDWYWGCVRDHVCPLCTICPEDRWKDLKTCKDFERKNGWNCMMCKTMTKKQWKELIKKSG